jgi:hypothetical protein
MGVGFIFIFWWLDNFLPLEKYSDDRTQLENMKPNHLIDTTKKKCDVISLHLTYILDSEFDETRI